MIETPIVPRVSETDGVGHVNNVFAPVWLEAGRRGHFLILMPDLSFARWRVALVNMNVDYLDQMYFQEDAVVRTWTDRVGTKSFTLYEEIWQGARHCVRGTATYAYMDPATGRATAIPDDARTGLMAHAREVAAR